MPFGPFHMKKILFQTHLWDVGKMWLNTLVKCLAESSETYCAAKDFNRYLNNLILST